MKLKRIFMMFTFTFIVIAFFCRSNTGKKNGNNRAIVQLQSVLHKEKDTVDECKQMAESINSFGLNMFNRIVRENNVIISPLSLYIGLSMLFDASSGATYKELKELLLIGNTEKSLHNAIRALQTNLSGSSKETIGLANSLWLHNGAKIKAEYAEGIMQTYNAIVNNIDFDAMACTIINEWIASNTKGKIEAFFNEFDPKTRALLINTLYFKCDWLESFDPGNTNKQYFYINEKDSFEISMMKKVTVEKYYENDSIQFAVLPFGCNMSMNIILPKETFTIDNIQNALNVKDLQRWNDSSYNKNILIVMPRFKAEFHSSLNNILIESGLHYAFSESANFSRLCDIDIRLSNVVHKALIEINENGATIASVSGFILGTKINREQSDPLFKINRPFIFAIRENTFGCILAFGKIYRPIQYDD